MIYWRNRLPSVKTLREVFGDRAKEARELLEGTRRTREYASVREWEKACFHKPRYLERLLCALNEVAGTYGVEYEEGPEVEFLNTGDVYSTTLCFIHGKGFRVTDVASIIERCTR